MPIEGVNASRSIRRRHRPRGLAAAWSLAAMLLASGWTACGAAEPANAAAIRPIATIRAMPAAEVARAAPAAIRGVVTFLAEEHMPKRAVIVQDDSGGIWVSLERIPTLPAGLDRGSEVEIFGLTDRGGFAPNLIASSLRIVGRRDLPAAERTSDERFFSGADTCRRIETDGILQGYRDKGKQWRLIMERSGRRFLAAVPKAMLEGDPAMLVDATLRITGVATSRFNTRGEFVSPRVYVQHADGLAVVAPPPNAAFAAPLVPLDAIAQFRPEPTGGHRIRTEGVVTYVRPGEFICLQEGPVGISVHAPQAVGIAVGDRVQVSGFLDRSGGTAGLVEALVRRIGAVGPPEPIAITPDEVIEIVVRAQNSGRVAQPGNYDGCLITFPARLVELEKTRAGGVLALVSGESSLQASLRAPEFARLAALQPGSTLAVTGIIQIDLADAYEDQDRWFNPDIKRLNLLLRSADDVAVIDQPSWWNPRRLAIALAGAGGVLAAALAWAWMLRRQLAVQTARLTEEMRSRHEAAVEFQATLRERNRLAANLHDTLLQSLAGIRFQLDACRVVSRQGSQDESAEHFAVARRMLDHAAQNLRGSVWALRTMPMPGQTFSESMETVVAQLAKTGDTQITLAIAGPPFEVPNFVAGNLLLVTQEAIHNAIRHGNPARIEVGVTFEPTAGMIDLVVRDDGGGFAPGTAVGPAQGHFGLQGMRERVERLAGSFRVSSDPSRGTTVRATVTTRAYDQQLEADLEPVTAAGGRTDPARP